MSHALPRGALDESNGAVTRHQFTSYLRPWLSFKLMAKFLGHTVDPHVFSNYLRTIPVLVPLFLLLASPRLFLALPSSPPVRMTVSEDVLGCHSLFPSGIALFHFLMEIHPPAVLFTLGASL